MNKFSGDLSSDLNGDNGKANDRREAWVLDGFAYEGSDTNMKAVGKNL